MPFSHTRPPFCPRKEYEPVNKLDVAPSLALRAGVLWRLVIVVVFVPGVWWLATATAAEKGKVSVEKVEYKGWKNNLRLSNGEAELIVTLDVGPRIISY